MDFRSIWAAIFLAISAASVVAQPLPANVSTRVGRAQTWVYAWTPGQYSNRLNDFDIIWDNTPTERQGGANAFASSATYSSAYTAINRVPAARRYAANTMLPTGCGQEGCTLEWFQINHPTWVIYRKDKKTPAFMFDDATWTPLDISNPEVQRFFMSNVYRPLFEAGYSAVSVDNVGSFNSWQETGTCSVKPAQGKDCEGSGGTWNALYTGDKLDPAYAAARIKWARQITAYAHSQGKSSIGNISDILTDLPNSDALVNAFDIWWDESGYTGGTVPSPCTPAVGGYVGARWIAKLSFITSLNHGAGPKAYVSSNSICPVGKWTHGKNSNFEIVEYAVASYLLSKTDYSYMAYFFADEASCNSSFYCDDRATASWPQFRLIHGEAKEAYRVTDYVYHRAFANLLALVNPSATTAHTYSLGAAVYHRSDCTRYSGTITVPAMTGLVLLNGEPPAICPLKARGP